MANFSGQSVKTQRRPNWVWFSRLCHWCVSTRQTTSVCQVQSRAVRWWTQKEDNFYNKKKKNTIWVSCSPPSPPPLTNVIFLLFEFSFKFFLRATKERKCHDAVLHKLNLTVELPQSVEFIGHQTRAFSVAAAGHVTGYRPINARHRNQLVSSSELGEIKLSFNFLAGATVALVCKWGICPWNVWGRQSANPRC